MMAAADIVVVGCGLAGAAVARTAADAGLDVRVLEAGLQGAIESGCHVTVDRRMTFASEARNRLTRGLLLPVEHEAASAFGRGTEFAVGAGSGGAGLVWSGICERLDAPTAEGREFLDACVEPTYRLAEELFGVVNAIDPFDSAAFAAWPSLRPLKTASVHDGSLLRVPGPRDLLYCSGGSAIDLRPGRVAAAIEHRSGRATGVTALNLHTNELEFHATETVVIAADAVRSPALMVASKIAPEPGFPVGQWLTDHPLAVARIAATTEEGRAMAESLIPKPEAMTCRGVVLAPAPDGCLRLIVGVPSSDPAQRLLMLYWYAVGHPDPSNELRFRKQSDREFGMHGASVRLNAPIASEDDLRGQLNDLSEVANRLGTPLRGWQPRLLPLGAAQHLFGTLRTTLSSSAPGVTSPDGKVRGFENLFVAGPARLPAPCAINPVLASTAAAIYTARMISGALPAHSAPWPKSAGRTEPRG
jgi:choline dehydrogenase-like flavoprotein